MTEPTQEQLRTEAYWRSTIARELYDRADQMERNAWSKTAGMALASIVRDAGNKVGQMPDRPVDTPGPDVVRVWDKDGDLWRRVGDSWRVDKGGLGEPVPWSVLNSAWAPIRTSPPGGA